jgi:hypothetical protein
MHAVHVVCTVACFDQFVEWDLAEWRNHPARAIGG